MILADKSIIQMIRMKEILIIPITPEQIQPASVDLRLGTKFLEPMKDKLITLKSQIEYTEINGDSVTILPGEFILATTMEYIKIPEYITAWVEGRSSIARLGLIIHSAGWIDPGFEGEITLELYNQSNSPILLESGRRVCQIVFAQLDKACENPYKGKYQGQKGPIGTRIYQDMEINV